jgi:hypothetical protein
MANLNDYTPNELYWKQRGVTPVRGNMPEYEFIGSSSTIHGQKKPIINDAVLNARKEVQEIMKKGSLSAPGIMRGVSGASFNNTHPQYVLEQIIGDNGLKDGMTVFGFDIESLGGFGPKSTSKIFAPTEIAIDAMTFNRTNPTISVINNRAVKNYFTSKGLSLNILRRLDDNELGYMEGLIKQLEGVKSINSITGIGIDDQRSLRDLIRYAGNAVFENNGVVSQNTRIPNRALLTAANVPAIREGLKNLQKNGLSTDDFIARINGYVGEHAISRTGNSFKTMAYNGINFDMVGLVSRFGGRVDLFNNGHSGMFDPYATANALYANPLQRFYGSGVKSGATDLTLENLSSVLFGVDTSKSHTGIVDVGNMKMLANYMMGDIDAVYMSGDNSRRARKSMMRQMPLSRHRIPSKLDGSGNVIRKENIRMATYDPQYLKYGDRLYANKGLVASEDSIYDMVFKLNGNKSPELLENYTNSILASRTYQIQGTFDFMNNGKQMWGMQLYNEDEDFLHMIIRDDPRKLQDIVHQRFSYIGSEGNLALETKELAGRYKDAARREYERLFSPSMDQYPGRSFDLLKEYIGAHDTVQAALGKELDERSISAGKHGYVQKRAVSKVAKLTGLKEAQARNYLYMRDRFSSELEDLVRPFVNRLEAEGITGANADLALWNFKQAIDTTAGNHSEPFMQKFGNEQMFILDPVKKEYKLANIGSVESFTKSLNSTIAQGGKSTKYKHNAIAILTDLYKRGYVDNRQFEILKGVLKQMDPTELENAKTMKFMQDLADNILRGTGKDDNNKLISRVNKEFGIANALGRAEEVAAGNAPDAYFIDKIKGDVKINTEQESLRVRNFDKGTLDYLRSDEVMGGSINRANNTLALSRKKFSESILPMDRETNDYLRQYDKYMRGRLQGISNLNAGIDFSAKRDDLSISLSKLAGMIVNKDAEQASAVSLFMDKNKQSLVMVIHNERDAAAVMKQGSLYMKNPNAVSLEIPLADMKTNTFRRGNQSLMNITFLETPYGSRKPGWGDVYGEGVTERTIRHYMMGAEQIVNAMSSNSKDAIKNAQTIAKRYADRAVAEVSGSGKTLDSLADDVIDATSNGAIMTRGGYVYIAGLTGLDSSLNGKAYDELSEGQKGDFLRYLSRSTQENGLPLTYQGVKQATSLRGMVSTFNSRTLVPLGAYGAATRENYQQVQNYYDLAKYNIYNPNERWRFESSLMTKTGFQTYKGELPGIAAKVSYMTDDKVMTAAKAAGIKDAGVLSVSEGMIMVADDMRPYLNAKEIKLIHVPQGMNLSDEMKELLAQADNKNVSVYLPDWEPGKKFTVAKAVTDEIERSVASPIEYGDKHRARIIGRRTDEKSGELIIELEQQLEAEDGMKLFIGTDKGTVRFVNRSAIEAIGGKGTDILAGAEWGKRQDFNNPIVGTINRIIDEAKGNGRNNTEITKAFKDHMDLDIEFKKQKLTIGDATVMRSIPVVPDLVSHSEVGPNRILLSQATKVGDALGVNFNQDVFQAVQEIRLARVSRFARPFGYNIHGEEGVKYGLRELEVIRNKKISINGKEYGTSGDTYKWFINTIDSRAQKKFDSPYKDFLFGIDRSLRSFDDNAMIEDGDLMIGLGRTSPISTENLKVINTQGFEKMKSIEGVEGITRADLRGTILDPGMRGKNSKGFWFETPFDWTIEGQDRPRNRLFLLQDDIKGHDGNLYPTEIQKHELAIERASREFIEIRDGKITHPRKTQQELLDSATRRGQNAINEYIKQVGKDVMGSHGRVAQDIFSGKIGNSGQFTIAGRNVFDNSNALDNLGKKASANTSYISEQYARGMFEGLDLSNEQISDIIEVMKNGEGIFTTTNRYPTFDEGSMVIGRTKISNKLSGDAAAISVGDAMRMKADYDGDHLYKVVAFANELKGTGLIYSAVAQQAQENYNSIVAGKMTLNQIENPLIREFTEMHLMSESDAQKSATLGKFWQANYLVDAIGDTNISGIRSMGERIDREIATGKGKYKDFGARLTTADLAMSEEFMTREGRIMKQVGSASNLNARMRRLTEALVTTPDVMNTIGKDMTDAMVGGAIFNSILPEETWARISTSASIFEQTGIGAKHIITLMDRLGIDSKTMTEQQTNELFGTLNKFRTGLENFDSKALREANEKFKALGWKDQLRLGSGEVTSASIEEIFGVAAIDANMDKDQLDSFIKSFRFLGSDEEESTKKLIEAVERVGNFMDSYEFKKNPFLKFSLSSSSDPEAAINSWKDLSNYKSRYFVPTAEVERLYSAMGKEEEFGEGKKLFGARMSMRAQDIGSGKYFSMDGDNFASITDEVRNIHTIGDDTVERIGSKVFSGASGGRFTNGAIGGVAAFGALWAASALMRHGPEENNVELPQADQAPSSDGKYVDPAVFGVAPRGTAPTARISPRGSGYENINITINADDAHGWSESEIRDIVQEQLSNQMPMNVNMNVSSKDNTQRIDRQWVNDTVTKAIKFGYAW